MKPRADKPYTSQSIPVDDWSLLKALGFREGRKPVQQLRWLLKEALETRGLNSDVLIAEFEAAQAASKRAG